MDEQTKNASVSDRPLPVLAPNKSAANDGQATASPTAFYLAGVGASAGGLEALEAFFGQMPPNSGLAFVVIQHLSPDFKSLMDELLSRRTEIAVRRVEDGMVVEPNTIYLMPPRKEMIISSGRLLLTDKDPSSALSLPIDTFFRSLAQDFGERAIGIVLSGTGSDGSRGIRAIHEAGGLVISQSEETAKFDGMPRSAIDTGVVDLVLPPAAMAEALVNYIKPPLHGVKKKPANEKLAAEDGMNAVFSLLRAECGIDFSHYKPNTVLRRIDRRLQLNRSLHLDEYVEQLRGDPRELNLLYKDLLIGVTRFFRDPDLFARLESDILPKILAKAPANEELRAWVAGCATGEEAYSLAILFHELLEADKRPLNVKIFATDVHRSSLEFASLGLYDESALTEVSPERLGRYFSKQSAGYQISQDLRKMIVFAPHNVIKDAPFTKLHLITCRNLLIYLQTAAQKKAVSLFHFGLNTGGILVLGPSEGPGELADEFETLDGHWKIYRKRRDVRLPTDMRLPLSPLIPQVQLGAALRPTRSTFPDPNLLKAYDELLGAYVPPSFLVTAQRELLHTFAGAGKYLSVPDGRPSPDVLDLVDHDLRLAIAGALQRAAKEGTAISYGGVVRRAGETEERLKVCVRPFGIKSTGETFFLISLEPELRQPEPIEPISLLDLGAASQKRLHELEDELRYTKENLQATVEEMETTNEELQATNEELVASNEELQSTNEELHSVNEELYTVNAEYQRKITELTELTDDMDNLLRSTDVGTIFLDRDLLIRKFTAKIAHAFQLLPQDVGRRIDSFAHNILHDGLLDDVRRVLETAEPCERDVQDRFGEWFLLRILPYRTKGVVEGVVVTLIAISRLKMTEQELRRLSKVFMDGADPIIIEDLSGRIVDLNREAERAYGWSREELLGKNTFVLVPSEREEQVAALRERCRADDSVRNVESLRRDRSGKVSPVLITLSLLYDDAGQPAAIASISKDITKLKQAEAEAREAADRRDQFLAVLSHELRNPLGAILNATHLLDRVGGDPERPSANACAVVERQAKQMARLLDDLLDVSRVTQGKIHIRNEVVDLRAIAEEAVQVAQPLMTSHGHTLILELSEQPIYVEGDAARLLQVQENLLENAAKYTPSGGTIRFSLHVADGQAVLQVRDNGVGVSPEMQSKIFDLFVQAPQAPGRNDAGMGIGLTLVRSIVELHQGHIAVRSQGLNQGSEFEVRLPLTQKAPAPRNAPAPALEAGVKVLIVEDNADNREILESLLRIDGYDVQAAPDGLRGYAAIVADRPDVALVDIELPGINGYQLAQKVRTELGDRSIRLVALTGYGRSVDRE
ncbi:MAG TPA: chemotaxis protein CheB, partial [Pirellulales bacterium]|nr:chemotaxis protein CheB [Pirellulales bacterium]